MSGNNCVFSSVPKKMDFQKENFALSCSVSPSLHLFFPHLTQRERSLMMTHSLVVILGKRGTAVSWDGNCVGNATLLSLPPACACGCYWESYQWKQTWTWAGWRAGGGCGEGEVGGGGKATVKLKDKKRNGSLEAGRDGEMDDRHMEDIKKV